MTRRAANKTARDAQPADNDRAGKGSSPTATAGAAVPNGRPLSIHDLGWSEAEAIDTHFRLRPFEEDWDAPGMDAYDDL